MAGIDRHIKHYRVNQDTGEQDLNTDINIFIICNAIAYIVFLVLIFTVGAFGGVSSTTNTLCFFYQSLVTTKQLFFQLAWGFIIPWHGFWAVWQIANPSERNCEGVVRAAYFYPFATLMYAGYTISVRFGWNILGCIFVYGLCGTLVGLAMSMQKYRNKTIKGWFLWQGPHSLYAAWIMIETMIMTNVVFVRLQETWIIKFIIAIASLLVIFITAIAWLSSYPVDLLIPFVLLCAVGGIWLKLLDSKHDFNLGEQGFESGWREGWRYGVIAIFVLILLAFILKVIVVLVHQRPRDQDERRKQKQSRVSVSITIDTGKNNDDELRKKKKKSRSSSRERNRGNYDGRRRSNSRERNRGNYDGRDRNYDDGYNQGNGYDDGYGNDGYGNGYDNGYDNGYNNSQPPEEPRSPSQSPKKKKKKKKPKSRDDSDPTGLSENV